MGRTCKELRFEALLGNGVVRLELDAHDVVLGGDGLWLLRTAELPMESGVGRESAPHLHIVVLTNLSRTHSIITRKQQDNVG